MAFRLEEFKKTTRKSAGGGPASVYPHQLKDRAKDKKALARLEVAIRTFDGSVGRRRADLDAQAMTDFFGDPRLARGIVACLRQFYRYETPDFAQAVGRDAAGRLAASGLKRPADVRARTYAFANTHYHGFLAEGERSEAYRTLAEEFCLSAHQWDTLLHLDAEENQVLTRPGAVPTPADIAALYNFHSLDTVLRRASEIGLSGLALSPAEAADVRALAKALGAKAVVSGDGATVTLREEQDTLLHRPARLGRCLLLLLQACGSRTLAGWAEAKIGTPFRLVLSTDLLRALGMPLKTEGKKRAFRRRMEAGAALHRDLRKLQARGAAQGWRMRRLPEPRVTAGGVQLADLALSRGASTVSVILGLEMGLEMGLEAGPAAEAAEDGAVLRLPVGRKPLDAADVLAQAASRAGSLFALPPAAAPPVPPDVLALCDRAAREGLVRAGEARRALHLLDETPLVDWVRQAADPRVRYIPGVGLCSQEMLTAIQGGSETSV